MLANLKNHPFGVVAKLERTTVLAFAVPRAELEALIPSALELDLFQEQWGFVAVALVRTKELRPAGFPKWVGNDFWLLGYRIFVRYRNTKDRRLRGLYILGSETDKRRMAFLGNMFTHYQYQHKAFDITTKDYRTTWNAPDGSSSLVVHDDPDVPASLPSGSVFKDWSEARRFIGPLPFTFSHDATRGQVLIIEGARTDWTPRPVTVERHSFRFLEGLGLSELRLSNAFAMDNVAYHWKPGVIEPFR